MRSGYPMEGRPVRKKREASALFKLGGASGLVAGAASAAGPIASQLRTTFLVARATSAWNPAPLPEAAAATGRYANRSAEATHSE